MKKSVTKLPGEPRIYISLAILFLVLWLTMPRTGKFTYDYRKGAPWTYETLVAQFDFPVLKTEEQLQAERDAAGKSVIRYYRYSESVSQEALRAAESLDFGQYPYLRQRVVGSLSAIYTRGIFDGADESSDEVIFVQRGKRANRQPAANSYTVSGARSKLLADARKDYPGIRVDSVFTHCGVYDLLRPNLIFDKETTNLVHAESAKYISPTLGYVSSGQQIVAKGEIVTAEIGQWLDSYKTEYENSVGYGGPRIFLWLGNGLLALLLVLVLYLSILYTNPGIFSEFNRFVYILFIIALMAVLVFLLERINAKLLYMTPFTLCVLFLLAFFRKKVVLPVYVVSLLPLLTFAHNGAELFLMYLVSGVVTIYAFDYYNKGWKQFVTALISFAALVLTFLAFHLINDLSGASDLRKIGYLFVASILSVLGYPLIYLFERVFRLVSSTRLVELADTNNPLLQELQRKAPGTFQHSLQVMNMADVAARSIGADVELIRAAAMYHDIGKMLNPLCFIENENDSIAKKYHEGLSPLESAHDIIRHVSDGVSQAEKYGLPPVIIDFIRSHHGTSHTGYFYNKYLNEGGDPAQEAEFRYPGLPPKTTEQVVLMLCDSVEAASRSLRDNTREAFDRLVEGIVAGKMKEGQFSESDISLKDLETVKATLKNYLSDLYHKRVVYPKRKA
ncbi:MAG: HDIG domain-containing protein [Bacteroidales bacterium]|nr:HDIG domain-containing protein [Bacteroidales bacterium]